MLPELITRRTAIENLGKGFVLLASGLWVKEKTVEAANPLQRRRQLAPQQKQQISASGGFPALNNLYVRLVASAGVYSDSGKTTPSVHDGDVVVWADQSGNGRDFGGGVAPVLKTSSNTINGKPTVYFDGSKYLTRATSLPSGSSGHVIAVYNAGNVSATQTLLGSCDTATTNYYFRCDFRNTTYSNRFMVVQKNNDTVDAIDAGTTAYNSSFCIEWYSTGTAYGFVKNNVSYSGAQLTAETGSDSGDWFADTSGRDNITIGGRTTTGVGNLCTVYLAEIIVIDGGNLTSDERTNLYSYLQTAYALW